MRLALLLMSISLFGQTPLAERPGVRRALELLEQRHEAHIAKQIEIAQIPSPGWEEKERAEFMRGEFRKLNLKRVEIDGIGNVLGWRPGKSPRTIVISAHLDTVFPRTTDVKVKKQGNRLLGPGLVDDSRGLLALLALAEALDAGKIETNHTLLFVGDVGEEGLGNLRGSRYLVSEGPHQQLFDAFISIDGAEPERIVNAELGSRRFRVTVKGPGGHSYNAFGTGNPAHALGRIMAKISDLVVPEKPRTTFSIGKIGGGTAINAIPEEAWFEIDMRSSEESELERMEASLMATVKQCVEEENKLHVRRGAPLTAEPKRLALRQAFPRSANEPMLAAARAAAQALGMRPVVLETASTDSNAAMAAGLPAMTIGGGGKAGGIHSMAEWFEPEGAYRGLQQALLLILGYDEKPHAK